MSACSDKNYRELLHLYELGLLDADQTDQFERHLMDCEACFEAVQAFSKPVAHLHHSPRVKQAVAELAEASEYPEKAATSRRGWWTRVSIAAAIALVILILRPWRFEFEAGHEAIAGTNRILIMPLENRVDPDDPDRLGTSISSLLAADLSESDYVHVIPTPAATENRGDSLPSALQAAEASRAAWLLTGFIESTEPLGVTIQLRSAPHGQIIAQQEAGSDPPDIFRLVDSLTRLVKANMNLPPEAMSEPDPDVSSVTTISEEAYRHYVNGLADEARLYQQEAIANYLEAIRLDSTFAMAYYRAALLGDTALARQAVKNANHATTRERHYIRSLTARLDRNWDQYVAELTRLTERWPDEKEAYYDLGQYYYGIQNYEEALRRLRQAIVIDPNFKRAYNLLAYAYDRQGDFENAILAINRYIELAPDEPNPYDSRGDLYRSNGKIEQAIRSYEQAVALRPDFSQYNSAAKLALLYLFIGDYDRARPLLTLLLESGNRQKASEGCFYTALIPYLQGKMTPAIAQLEACITFDLEHENAREAHYKIRTRAFALAAVGLLDSAVIELDRMLAVIQQTRPGEYVSFRCFKAQFMSEQGHLEAARAVVDTLLQKDLGYNPPDLFAHSYAQGALQMAEQNYAGAVASFDTAYTYLRIYPALFWRGVARLRANQLSQAVSDLEKAAGDYSPWRLYSGPWSAQAHYYLGLAYEESNWPDKALEQYRRYAEVWGEADYTDPLLRDARARIKRLSAGS